MTNERKHVAEVYNRDDMLAFYDTLATRYGLGPAELRLMQRHCHVPGSLLVVGCGTGREALALHRHEFTPLVGIDIARRTLQIARQKCQQLSIQGIAWHQADVAHLPYRDATFNYVLMLSQVIQNIPGQTRRQQALQEVRRVLTPDGICLISSFNQPISLLYMLLLGRQAQAGFARESSSGQERGEHHVEHDPPLWLASLPLLSKIIRRIAWELHPTIQSYESPLPLTWRIGFWGWCKSVNTFRRIRNMMGAASERLLEPNDFMLDHRNFRFHLFPQAGDLFAHFPDVDEMLSDMSHAGLTLMEYRSLEELQREVVLSDTLRRSKRLLFYVAQK